MIAPAWFKSLSLRTLVVSLAYASYGMLLASPPLAAAEPRSLQVGVQLNVRVLLQGAYDPALKLMRDDLRATLLPTNQPYQTAPFDYAGTETLNKALAPIAVGGDADAVVDWVLLELRSAADAKLTVARRAVGVQRDGDLMDMQTGETTQIFLDVEPGSYHVAVRHRNHLGVLTGEAQTLAFIPITLDFSLPTTPVTGQNARYLSGNVALMWGGDANQDGRVVASGGGNDTNAILSPILLATGNTGFNASYRLLGYHPADLDMDGEVIYAGPGNDTNIMTSNILLHPANSTFAYNYIVNGGL